MTKKEKLAELRGVGKILDILWTNSYNWGCCGEHTSKRLEVELIYYFGKNWTTKMYDLIETPKTPHKIEPIQTLKELLTK